MNSIAKQACTIFKQLASQSINHSPTQYFHNPYQMQQWRGIRVKVLGGNLERALTVMHRTMNASGIERLLKRQQSRHLKNSEKRVLARKRLQYKIKSQELARKLKAILIKKVRGL